MYLANKCFETLHKDLISAEGSTWSPEEETKWRNARAIVECKNELKLFFSFFFWWSNSAIFVFLLMATASLCPDEKTM